MKTWNSSEAPVDNHQNGKEGQGLAAQFCFFAHHPEELRQPELAELRKPPKQRRREATPQNAVHQTKPPADTVTVDQVHISCLPGDAVLYQGLQPV